ncbi:MAG: PPC domain-containing DNA-binding protein [Halanaeroarchaeum sp.]
MQTREVSGDREFFCTLEHGATVHEELAAFAAAEDVETGWFWGTGAVQDATLATDDQDEFATERVDYAEPLGMPALAGWLARDEAGDPTVVATAVLARPSGQALAGRLDRATVFDAEVYVHTFAETIARTPDAATDRETWTV